MMSPRRTLESAAQPLDEASNKEGNGKALEAAPSALVDIEEPQLLAAVEIHFSKNKLEANV